MRARRSAWDRCPTASRSRSSASSRSAAARRRRRRRRKRNEKGARSLRTRRRSGRSLAAVAHAREAGGAGAGASGDGQGSPAQLAAGQPCPVRFTRPGPGREAIAIARRDAADLVAFLRAAVAVPEGHQPGHLAGGKGEKEMKPWLLGALLAFAPLALAQSWGPRTLDELKQETVRRAERNMVPLTGIKAEDAREAMAGLKSLEPDEWAAAWSRIGERYFAQGDYFHAWDIFNVARWPSEKLSPGKAKAYARALEAFQLYGKSLSPAIETVRIPFEGKEIVAYLRLPQGVGPAPLVFGINGLDSRKEEVIARADRYLKAGVGVFAIDMPGTGQAPILIDVGAERMFSRALDYLQTRKDVDAKRIVVQGRSWSGYWAALMAYTEKDRIRGAVVHGVGIHDYFSADWQKKAFSSRE